MSSTSSHPAAGAPTLATVAEEAGVSRQTVSNALNSPDLLRPDTLARVQEAIDRLGYSPNRAARSLRTRSSHLVGLRVDPAVEDSANALMDRFVHSLVESTEDAGYHVLLFTAGGDHEAADAYDELLRSAAVDAFVLTDTFRGNPHAAWLTGRGGAVRGLRPAVGRRRRPSTPGWTSTAGRASCWPSTTSSSAATAASPGSAGRRARSSARTVAAAGSTGCTSAACRPAGCRARGDDTLEFGRAGGARAARRGAAERPTAFVCASDTVAMGVLRTLDELGLRPGRDVAVVGFDDSIAAQVSHARR